MSIKNFDPRQRRIKKAAPRWKVTVRRDEADAGVDTLEFFVYAKNGLSAMRLVQAGAFRHPKRPLELLKISEWASTYHFEMSREEHRAKLVTDLPNVRK